MICERSIIRRNLEKISTGFEQRWNFPNALGAIDGKQAIIQALPNSSSLYINYKKTFSIILMAVCDAKYKFTLVDTGDTGRQSSGSVYANSQLGHAIENGLLNTPHPSKVPQSEKILPYVFIGDDAFGLKNHLMKPYPFQHLSLAERVFNYRSSRARRVIENVFGIPVSRFRVLHRLILAKPTTVISITKAIVALHNFLMSLNSNDNTAIVHLASLIKITLQELLRMNGERTEKENILGLRDIEHLSSNNYSKNAKEIRDSFKRYFNREGEVE